jgi:hypothetical protein
MSWHPANSSLPTGARTLDEVLMKGSLSPQNERLKKNTRNGKGAFEPRL